jgi:tRNA threonylcarbamoyl adenosine modification protein YjeE
MPEAGQGSWRAQATLVDDAATARLGALIAGALAPGDMIGLAGGLGAGKTALARAIIRHLAAAPIEVPSPTFTLVQEYRELPVPVLHYDLYRIASAADLAEIGLEELDPGAAHLVEWPEKAGSLIGPDALWVSLAIDGSGRRAALSGSEDWRQRLGDLPEPI